VDAQRLEEEASEFAVELMLRLAEILPTGALGFTCEAAPLGDGSARMTVVSEHKNGIPLTIEGEPRLQLEVNFALMLSPNSRRATVLKSSFLVRPHGQGRPLFTLDYVRDAHSNTPSAHYNFHLDHDLIENELLSTGAARRGKSYRRDVAAGRKPRVADLHFPVGGHRFRPCLEDVIEMLWIEFGIDVKTTTAGAAIKSGREAWRTMQVRAAVADDPENAAAELRELGYIVSPPSAPRASRFERIHAI